MPSVAREVRRRQPRPPEPLSLLVPEPGRDGSPIAVAAQRAWLVLVLMLRWLLVLAAVAAWLIFVPLAAIASSAVHRLRTLIRGTARS